MSKSGQKPLHPLALLAIVVGWLAFACFGVVMAYAAWTEENFDWYLAIGPTIGAVFAVGGALGLPFVIQEQVRRRAENDPDA